MSVFGKVANQRWLVLAVVAMIASPAMAALAPDDTWTRPGLSGTNYEHNLGPIPADYTFLTSLVSPHMAGSQLDGITTTRVYKNNFDGTLAFSYVVDTMGFNNPTYITGADMDGLSWNGIIISRAGADASGLSGSGDVAEWADGSPHSITRANPPSGPQSPSWEFKSGSIGTVIGPNNISAEIWFATNAKTWTTAFIAYLGQGSVGRAEVLVPVIPDPATLALLSLGACGAFIRRRRTA
ncbi:MAG: PEP-CTERM sorting domain-containing protein [Phycisphaerae bacterium]|jgi:hypothetical protein